MRVVGLGIVVLSGTVMASVGTIANAFGRYQGDGLLVYGSILVGIATLLIIIDHFRSILESGTKSRAESDSSGNRTADV
ncbi:MAG: hypothetical protein FWD61_02950 [Phycisphaerales bacterium]|nr:hypothetical protein [Phycisphaerales bacterium]